MSDMRDQSIEGSAEMEPSDERSLTERSERALGRIALSLGVPVDTLRAMAIGSDARLADGDEIATEEECSELVAAFRRVKHLQTRRLYLAVLQSLSKR